MGLLLHSLPNLIANLAMSRCCWSWPSPFHGSRRHSRRGWNCTPGVRRVDAAHLPGVDDLRVLDRVGNALDPLSSGRSRTSFPRQSRRAFQPPNASSGLERLARTHPCEDRCFRFSAPALFHGVWNSLSSTRCTLVSFCALSVPIRGDPAPATCTMRIRWIPCHTARSFLHVTLAPPSSEETRVVTPFPFPCGLPPSSGIQPLPPPHPGIPTVTWVSPKGPT